MKKIIASLVLTILAYSSYSQKHELKSTVEIYQDLQELQRGLRVLYIAAHPDDENTRLISWLENDQHVETAYLSLTRGQGGQNLIGDEKGDALGVIRSYELLEARKIDGGEQFFARAVDFGYSKSAEESFEFWGKEEVLHDVVYVIRKFRPHVIINRFPSTSYAGHGHHTASAIVSEEAFDLASDPKAFSEQLDNLKPWAPLALFHNSSSWWDKSLDEKSIEELESDKTHRVNIGVYNDILGAGMNEIAALARSKHRCQAFGTPRQRGYQTEYLKLLKGDWSDEGLSNLKGIWEQSPDHANALQTVLDSFSFIDRSHNYQMLQRYFMPKMAQRSMWADPQDMRIIHQKVNELKLALNGIRVEVYAGEDRVIVGKDFPVKIEVYNSSDLIQEVGFNHDQIDTTIKISAGEAITWEATLTAEKDVSNPFWLKENKKSWLYAVDKAKDIGKPIKEGMTVPYYVKIDNQNVQTNAEVHRRWNDRSVGEISEPMVFVQPLTINPSVKSLVLKKGASVDVNVNIEANEDLENMMLWMDLPEEGWQVYFEQEPFSLKKGQVKTIPLKITADEAAQPGKIGFFALVNDVRCDQSISLIDYEHIPFTAIHTPAETELTPLELTNDPSKKILYIEGSGDEVDESLQLIGYSVEKSSLSGISLAQLKQYDAVVCGIRAFNQNKELAANQDLLMAYVMNGGNMIVQYNTTYGLDVDQIGPFPLKLSRDRVTDEHATVNLLNPDHQVFNRPNTIGDSDWENWVQERGLYFAGEWGESYTPLISWSDKGEEAVKGALLVAPYGKGNFVYTGISFFRQLPAGVPGAFRLFVNLIELHQ